MLVVLNRLADEVVHAAVVHQSSCPARSPNGASVWEGAEHAEPYSMKDIARHMAAKDLHGEVHFVQGDSKISADMPSRVWLEEERFVTVLYRRHYDDAIAGAWELWTWDGDDEATPPFEVSQSNTSTQPPYAHFRIDRAKYG